MFGIDTVKSDYFLRFVLKGPIYNPMDVMNVLMCRRGYRWESRGEETSLTSEYFQDGGGASAADHTKHPEQG